ATGAGAAATAAGATIAGAAAATGAGAAAIWSAGSRSAFGWGSGVAAEATGAGAAGSLAVAGADFLNGNSSGNSAIISKSAAAEIGFSFFSQNSPDSSPAQQHRHRQAKQNCPRFGNDAREAVVKEDVIDRSAPPHVYVD